GDIVRDLSRIAGCKPLAIVQIHEARRLAGKLGDGVITVVLQVAACEYVMTTAAGEVLGEARNVSIKIQFNRRFETIAHKVETAISDRGIVRERILIEHCQG